MLPAKSPMTCWRRLCFRINVRPFLRRIAQKPLSGSLFLFENTGAQRNHLCIQRLILFPCFGKIDVHENGGGGAFVGTGFAINTLLRVDKQHRFAFMKALARANDHAICKLAVKTRFSNNMRHGRLPKQVDESENIGVDWLMQIDVG